MVKVKNHVCSLNVHPVNLTIRVNRQLLKPLILLYNEDLRRLRGCIGVNVHLDKMDWCFSLIRVPTKLFNVGTVRSKNIKILIRNH